MKTKLLSAILALIMVLAIVPAMAEGGKVAKIGDTEYATLDAAIEAAADKATIVLLSDCTTAGMNLSKDLTIDGGEATKYTVTFNDEGIALWGKSLTFKNCNVVMNGIGSTPYEEWSWVAVCASEGASLTLENTEMTMTGAEGNNASAIYFCSNNKLNLTNSKLEIKEYQQNALGRDGGDGEYSVNIKNSTFISDHNRSGFTGTFTVKIDNSEVDVINSTGNGSNGSHFEIVNGSVVKFNDNGVHGLSAGKLTISNSTVEANENGANGVHVTGELKIENNSNVTIQNNRCTISSEYTKPGALYIAGESSIAGSTITITGNEGSGIYQKSGELTVDTSAKLTINNNKAIKLGYGDNDIYSEGKITFGNESSNWILDGNSHKIYSWNNDETNHWLECTDADCQNNEGSIMLKAEHSFQWVVDRAATATQTGSEHEECEVCGYQRASVEIPATGGNNDVPAPTTVPVYPTVTPRPYSGSSSSGNTYSWYFNPTPSPAPVVVPAAVALPKTGDMTIWQSILSFLGII